MKQLKSNYARINNNTGVIELLEKDPPSNGLEVIIEDCVLEFDENNNCIIKGKRWDWGFAFEKTFLSKLNYGVIDKHTKVGYETFMDRVNGLKSAYVKRGWHLKSVMPPYEAIFSKFFIII